MVKMYDDDKTRKIYHEMVSDSRSVRDNNPDNFARLQRLRHLNGIGYMMIVLGVAVLFWSFI